VFSHGVVENAMIQPTNMEAANLLLGVGRLHVVDFK